MATLEEVLRKYGYQFSPMLDASGRDELLSFWDNMTKHEGGTLSYAEIEQILSAYLEVGVIESVDAIRSPAMNRSADTSPKKERTLEEDRNPLVVAGRLLTQETEKRVAEEATAREEKKKSPVNVRDCLAEQEAVANQAAKSAGQTSSEGKTSVNGDARTVNEDPQPIVTWRIVTSSIHEASVEHPLMVLADPEHRLTHHVTGDFTNPEVRTAFECRLPAVNPASDDTSSAKHASDDTSSADHASDGTSFSDFAGTPAPAGANKTDLVVADILTIDKRFIKLVDYLGSGYIPVRLSGRQTDAGYAVYKIHAADPNGNETLENANDSFLQFNIRRLLASDAPEMTAEEVQAIHDDDHMLLTDMASMMDFLKVSGDTLPPDILRWAYRNIALVKTDTISPEEKRHAKRALSLVLNVQWKGSYFESIDPVEARRILDEELFGMENVKQRVIETIIQINRTHTLPSYGLLLVGPAGTGKSQIAYAVARILKLPWAALDMSAIHDAEALTGSPRVYSNAKAGRIMEAFSQAGSSNIVFIINELDKAESRASSGNPADALLTLLDNLGYTDNYIECVIPTGGVYPIATANDKSKISDPLLTRFAVIDIPDYTLEERATIFKQFSLPKVLRRMGMTSEEVSVTDGAVDVIVEHYKDMPGVRDLEQAAEHLAANALYRIETTHVTSVVFDAEMTKRILEE